MGLLTYLRGIGKGSKCKTENEKDRLITRVATINKRRGKNSQTPLPLSEEVLNHIVDFDKIDYLLRFNAAIEDRGDRPASDAELIGMVCGCGSASSADAAAAEEAPAVAEAGVGVAGEGAVCPDIDIRTAIDEINFDDNTETLIKDLKSMLGKSVVQAGLTDSKTLYYGMVEDILRDLKAQDALGTILEESFFDALPPTMSPESRKAFRDIATDTQGGGKRARSTRRTKRNKGKSRGRARKATRVRRNNNSNSNKTKRNKGKKRRTRRA